VSGPGGFFGLNPVILRSDATNDFTFISLSYCAEN